MPGGTSGYITVWDWGEHILCNSILMLELLKDKFENPQGIQHALI